MSQNQTEVDISGAQAQELSFVASGSYSETKLRDFCGQLSEDGPDKNLRCNPEQQQMVESVVDQIIKDMTYVQDKRRTRPKQFIRLLHGGPGTGKSHVIKILRQKLLLKQTK